MSISPKSLLNLSRDGRAPAFTREQALAVLKNRILAGAGTTVPDFIKLEFEEGNLPSKVSVPTMYALLKGRMYPDLIDPDTGKVFDYSTVPSAPAGRPTRFDENGIDPVTKDRRRGIPPLRQWLLDKTLEEARTTVDRRVVYHFVQARRELDVQLDQMRKHYDAKIAVMEKRLRQLNNYPSGYTYEG